MIERDTEIADAEIWFRAHGLPWFVDAEHERVHALLGRGRLTTITLLAAVPALALGITLGVLSGAPSSGFALFATLTGALALAWVALRLRAGPVLGWALRRIRGQLYLLVPLVTRALPLLLIFTVFFFINTEVWQVASSLPPGVLWLSVLMFAALAVLFLVARLPERWTGSWPRSSASRTARRCAGHARALRSRTPATTCWKPSPLRSASPWGSR